MPPKQQKPPLPKGHADGLALALANNQFCRELILQTGSLLRWPTPKSTGVISSASLRMNKAVMFTVASILGPQSDTAIGINVPPPKVQARATRALLRCSFPLSFPPCLAAGAEDQE